MRKRLLTRVLSLAGVGMLAGIFGSPQADAQFQAIYGNNLNEFGRQIHKLANGNIATVGECPNPTNPAQTDIYVVITTNAGIPVNQWAIDVIGGNDFGKDLTETTTGNLVIVGNAAVNGKADADIVALEMNPATGAIAWAKLYSGAFITGNFNDECSDVENVGNGYVIAGKSNSNHGPQYDAVLFKIDLTGGWRWGISFDGGLGTSDENFYTSTQLTDGSLNLVAGGWTLVGGNADIFMVEVSANGNTIAATRFAAPGNSNEGVRSIKPCDPLGPNAGNVVVAGNTGLAGTSRSMIGLVPTAGLAAINAHTISPPGAGWNEGMSIVETPAPEFRFVMAGLVSVPPGGFGNNDIYITRVQAPLAPLDFYNIFGGANLDQGWGVDLHDGIGPDPYSIIATGVWTTNALAQQVPIIRTNWGGTTPGCESRQVPVNNVVQQFTAAGMPLCPPLWGLFLDNVTPRVAQVPSPPIFCPGPNFSIRPSRGIVGDSPEYSNSINADSMTVVNLTSSGVDERASDRQALVAFPNPIKRGSAFNLGYTLESSSRVTITVSDMTGKVVFNGSIDQSGGPNRTPVSTDGWASGTYVVQVVSERSTITRRIVIGD